MSAVYYHPIDVKDNNKIIYTGGHDGTLIGWNFETGYSRYALHT